MLLFDALYIFQTGSAQKVSRRELTHRPTSNHDPEQRDRDGKDLITSRSYLVIQLNILLLTVAHIQLLFARVIREGIRTVPSTLKNNDGISFPSVVVDTANTPSGKVKPHQPILNGNLLRLMLASAKKSQTIAKPHMMSAINQPTTYKISPAFPAAMLSV